MSRRSKRKPTLELARWRLAAIVLAFGAAVVVLEARVVYLQIIDKEFLSAQGDARHLRTVNIEPPRGSITDRNGEPLAVSTPVDSIWAVPAEVRPALDRIEELARALDVESEWLARRIGSNIGREFVYLKRHLSPTDAATVLKLGIPGIHSEREYRRYHPAGEVAGHVLGFTDIDDRGQEGLEFAFDYWLAGEPGSKRVRQDREGRVIGDVEQIKAPRPGRELRTSLDLRLQYLAYRELKAAVTESQARSGSIVMLDAGTGEVLAMVNQPSFNPNNRAQRDAALYKNRAATDMLEPGSAFKPLVLAAAIEDGGFRADTMVDTSPGVLEVDGRILTEDTTRLGLAPLSAVLARSSNVGMGKVGLELEPRSIWNTLNSFGIGRLTGSGFPGESAGYLAEPTHWGLIGQATLSYGYGLALTPLQLARAYAAIAGGGLMPPVSFLALDAAPARERVIEPATAAELMEMLELVVAEDGTGYRAAVPNYRVAGKTGTAKMTEGGRYSDDRYTAVFAGMAPASSPRIVMVVVIKDPRGQAYYGGDVAAPVFSRVMAGSLRILAIAPDAPVEPHSTLLSQAQLER